MKFLGSSRQSSVAWSHNTLAIVSFEVGLKIPYCLLFLALSDVEFLD
jgi:hypothetical protein